MSIRKEVYDLLSKLPDTLPEVPSDQMDAWHIALADGLVGITYLMSNSTVRDVLIESK